MKTRASVLLIITIAVGMSLFFSSCEKDEAAADPVINLTELGYDNSKVAFLGTDLHIEADIVAEGTIDKVTIEIHPEGEHDPSGHDHGWEFEAPFDKFSGMKNATFHEHIDIPVTAEAGDYHFHFAVTDLEGQQTVAETELEVRQPDDAVNPVMSIASAPSNNQVFDSGETITISGTVSDDKALGGMYVGLVREDQNLTNADVNAMNTITLLHTHNFDSPTSHNFSASITVGASQDNNITPKDIVGDIEWQSTNYYLLVKCKDAFGGNWTFSERYPVVLGNL